MQTPDLEAKRIFLIGSADEALIQECRRVIEKHISKATVYSASHGGEVLFKIDNILPHVAILDHDLPGFDGFKVTDKIVGMSAQHPVSVILVTHIPDDEHFVNEVITRQVQFLENYQDEQKLNLCLTRALNRLSIEENSSYRLHFLTPGATLFLQGDESKCVYYVKRGELSVTCSVAGKTVLIGQVEKGEFVGEMAHFNREPRSATVTAVTDCEMIEIPSDALDFVLFSKPSWAKALIATLSKRLKRSNDRMTS